MACFTRGCYRSDNVPTLLNGVSINGIDPSGTFLTIPLLMVLLLVKTSSRFRFLMLPVKQSILLVELSHVVLSNDRLPNAITTLLKSRILLLKILNSRLVYTGHSLFHLQRVDFITLTSLSPCHNWPATHSSSVAPFLTFTFRLARSSFSLGWAGYFLRVSLLLSTLLSVLVGLPKHPSRYITTLVIVIILVLVAPTGPGSNSRLVLSLPIRVWQHSSCSSHIPNNYRVNWGAHTHHPAVSFVARESKYTCANGTSLTYGPLHHLQRA